MLYKGFDAASPPPVAPAGCAWVAGYIGGNAPVWSHSQWVHFLGLRQFPIWLADFAADPVDQARHACLVASRMGWNDNLTRAIIADTEAASDRAWYQSWATTLHRGGYLEANYGSLGTPAHPIAEANGSGRIWAADWDGDPILEVGQAVMAHQYRANVPEQGTLVDFSVMNHSLLLLGGYGARRTGP